MEKIGTIRAVTKYGAIVFQDEPKKFYNPVKGIAPPTKDEVDKVVKISLAEGDNPRNLFTSIMPIQQSTITQGSAGNLPTKDQSIIRQVCIKAACEYYSHRGGGIDLVILAAKRFEKYVNEGE